MVHVEDGEVEELINRSAKKIFWTFQNTKTNKSVFVSLAVERVLCSFFFLRLTGSCGYIERL